MAEFKPGDKVKIIGPKEGMTGVHPGWSESSDVFQGKIGWVDAEGLRSSGCYAVDDSPGGVNNIGYYGMFKPESLELVTEAAPVESDIMDDEPAPDYSKGYPSGKSAKQLGLKVGMRFRVINAGTCKVGDIVELQRDDGTTNPFFMNMTNNMPTTAISWCKLAPLEPEAKAEQPEVPTATHQFKVGDAVKVVSQSYGWGFVNAGHKGIISRVIGPDELYICFPGAKDWKAASKDLVLLEEPQKTTETVAEKVKEEPMTHRYKVGDHVRVCARNGDADDGHEFPIGTEVVIKRVDDDDNPYKCYYLDMHDHWFCQEDELELIKKEGIMSNILNKVRELALSREEKLRRKYGVHDEYGRATDAYDELMRDIQREEYLSKIDAKLTEAEAEDAKEAKKSK